MRSRRPPVRDNLWTSNSEESCATGPPSARNSARVKEMQQLLPLDPSAVHTDVAVLEDAVAAERREHLDGRPWVFVNMVTSIDGAATVDGRSGDLGGDGDRRLFSALRAEADVIVAGAETVRAERYRLPRAPGATSAAHRRDRGQEERPRLCVVSRSGSIGDAPLLDELPNLPDGAIKLAPWQRPILATVDGVASEAASGVDRRFEVIGLGAESVDLAALIAALAERGMRRILCEGGPSLLAQLAAAGLVDEWNFTVAPVVAGGEALRPVHTPTPLGVELRLDRLFQEDSTLFGRYLSPGRPDDVSPPSP